MTQTAAKSGRSAVLVAMGILASRLVGLVRQRLLAHYLGNGVAAAIWSTATRIPNVLQNLLGEGVLSASFIPAYAGLRAQGKDDEARDVAGAVFGILCVVVGTIVGIGVLATPLLVSIIASEFEGETRTLTIAMVRLIFPATGVLVLSAWCLGILNSHKRFFLSYAAPVAWNGVIIAVILVFRDASQNALVEWCAWGFVVGSVAQFAVQLPSVMRVLGRFSPRPSLKLASVQQVVRGFVPALVARGVVQVSSLVDLAYAGLIDPRAVSTLTNAQTIALLPVSLFGMAISAAELPEMSADAVKSTDERAKALRARLSAGLGRLAFFLVPSAVGFIALGDLISGVLLESGRFTAADSRLIWYVLLGSGVALTAQTSGRLYSSAFYALKDTRTPLKFAAIRVSLGIALGYYAVRILPGQLGLPADLGVVFITVTTGVTAWVEYTLLRRALSREIGAVTVDRSQAWRIWASALVAGAVSLGAKMALGARFGVREVTEWGGSVLPPPALPVLPTSLSLLALFCAIYGVGCLLLGVNQASALVRRGLRRR